MKTIMSMVLPQVGDELVRLMTGSKYDPSIMYRPEPCIVTYVNENHRWYQVTFINSGIKECYGVPIFDHGLFAETWRAGNIPVVCLETGLVWSSITECAKEMGLDSAGVARQLKKGQAYCGGYHFETVI